MPAAQPCRIRGVVYPSQTEAARAIGVHVTTISNALRDGREDRVGIKLDIIGTEAPPPYLDVRLIPTWVGGRRFRSRSAAARALGISPQCLAMRIARQKRRASGAMA
jgi:DNA-binding transcriptional LysR family regulator